MIFEALVRDNLQNASDKNGQHEQDNVDCCHDPNGDGFVKNGSRASDREKNCDAKNDNADVDLEAKDVGNVVMIVPANQLWVSF